MNITTFFERRTQAKAMAFTILNVVFLMAAFFSGKALALQDLAFGLWLLSFKFLGALLLGVILYQAQLLGVLSHWHFDKRQWLAIAIPVLFLATFIAAWGFEVPSDGSRPVWILLLSHQSTGFFEEFLFRGVMLLGLVFAYTHRAERNPIGKAVLVSAAYFGGIHLFSVLQGAPVLSVSIQILFAAFAGIMLALLLVMSRNIWLVSVIHGLMNSTNYSPITAIMPQEYFILFACVILASVMYKVYTPQYGAIFTANLKAKASS